MTDQLTEVFKAAEPLDLGNAKFYVFPDPKWIEIEIIDPETDAAEIQSFSVDCARELRDWLNKVLP